MKNKIVISLILLLLVVVYFFVFSGRKNESQTQVNQDNSSQVIFFYGDTCPHCKVVEAYISNNGIKDKISFQEREVYNNRSNSAMLLEKAKLCGIQEDSIGVPFLWDGEKCYTGVDDVIKFFDNKINENK